MLGPFCAFCSSVTWTVATTGYSSLSRNFSAFSISLMRASIALPLFVLWAVLSAGSWPALVQSYRDVSFNCMGWYTVSMFASYGLGDVLFLWATRYIGIPSALALASSYPVWTAIVGVSLKGEHLSILQIAGLLVTIGGMVMVILNSPVSQRPFPNEHGKKKGFKLKGVALGFCASVLWAMNSVAVAQAGQGLSLPVANSVRMGIGFLMSAGFCLLFTPQAPLFIPFRAIRKYAWMFVIETFGGSAFYTYGLMHSTLAVGATLSSLSPVISVPIAWGLGLEKFSVYRTLGVCLVVLGIVFLMGGISFR